MWRIIHRQKYTRYQLDKAGNTEYALSAGCEHYRMLFRCLCQPSSFLASNLKVMASFHVLLLIRFWVQCIISVRILLLLALEVSSFGEVWSCKLSPANSNTAKVHNDQKWHLISRKAFGGRAKLLGPRKEIQAFSVLWWSFMIWEKFSEKFCNSFLIVLYLHILFGKFLAFYSLNGINKM